jgi:hypothetical protein
MNIEKLEKKFDLAKATVENAVETLEELGDGLIIHEGEPAELVPYEEVFTISLLKQDFMMVRQNLVALIAKGQRLLNTSSEMDATELKASQVEALSELQNSISANLKLLIDIYKQVSDIEKAKRSNMVEMYGRNGTTPVNMGSVTTNNIVFTGTPSDLLAILKNDKGSANK